METMMAQQINRRLLPDGSGRIRIHWFCRDEAGPVKIVGGQTGPPPHGKKVPPSCGFIACAPESKSVNPEIKGGKIHVLEFTDDPRAATCPECQAHPRYKEMMALLEPPAEASCPEDRREK